MIDKIARVIVSKKRSGHRVLVNANASFKVETTYLTIISLLLDVGSVFYMHEATRGVIELPLGIGNAYVELLKRLKESMPRHEVERMYGIDVDELAERGWDGLVQAGG